MADDAILQADAQVSTPEPDAKNPRNLAEWVDVLSQQGMPIFTHTLRSISGMAADRQSSASELANVILQDAAMTAKLLRIANSPYYNTQAKSISTVSRAVVLLGFDAVRGLALSIAVVESAARGANKARLAADMARAFHAAVQARAFAQQRRDRSPEEVFIATLLFSLGRLAFWGHASEVADRLNAELEQPGADPVALERELLGFAFDELSLQLAREWRLGTLVENALEGKGEADPRVSNVELARELALTAEQGWDTPEMKQLLSRLAENLYLPVNDVEQMVVRNAGEAQKVAACFGAGDASELIPLPQKPRARVRREAEDEPGQINRFPEPDPMLQLKILREVTSLVEGRFDFNLMLEMVLEGIYRGAGMDRTLFALLSRDRSQLKARYVLGWDQQALRQHFAFEVSPVKANIFLHVLDSHEPCWISRESDSRLLGLVTDEVRYVTGEAPFMAMPILIQNRAIGLFYADRLPSRRPLREDDYSSFRHFGQQANMALSLLYQGR
ncbi:signal transduction protein with HDOD/GAF domains [Thiohalobacter sp. COW1]|uniref:HDOD domain-containing protein n=1 Tax=Thiohalobacter sp. COW1 TaxID=2795687 RepID=UPI0019158C98|nr:HDOD domain-containing protein [Thiohalobacter sp. COW1]BCO30185.1 signal transduction protein with HDOD/GAF domains [Thiohalobacter sp. COW1]